MTLTDPSPEQLESKPQQQAGNSPGGAGDTVTAGRSPGGRSRDEYATVAHESKDTKASAGLHVRCPHCHNPVELMADAELESISCDSCGSGFSLVGDAHATRPVTPKTDIAHFELIDRVGMGAFGTVWKAHDTKLDRTVAIKIPRKGQFDEKQERAFLREAQNAARLHHSGIVPVHEVGRDDTTLFIVSEFIDGLSLADWLTGQQLTPRESAELVIEIAEALGHAHEHGVVHRDLKPGNIMLDEDGAPHLMDFGLAKRDAAEITMSFEGKIIGTPAYMSPEQAGGDGNNADARSDIYSLGVILFELLTGELPFRGNARMLIHQVVHEEPPSPRALNSTAPRELETITLKCLSKDPERRYATAEALAADLGRWLRNEPIHARPTGVVEKAWKWVRRNPAPAASVAVVVLSLAAVAGGAFSASLRDRARVAELEVAKAETEQALQQTKAAQARTKEALAVAEEATETANAERDHARQLTNFQAAEHALDGGDLGEAFTRLRSADMIAPQWEYGNFYAKIVREARRWFAPLHRIELDRPPRIARIVMPKDRRALLDGGGWLFVVDSQGVETLNLLDGERVAALGIGAGLITGEVEQAHVVAPADPAAPPRVAVVTKSDGLLVLSVPDLKLVARGPKGYQPDLVQPAAAAPQVVALLGDRVSVIDASTGKRLAEAPFSDFDRVDTVAISPNGQTVAVGPFSVQDDPVAWRWKSDEKTKIDRKMQSFAFADDQTLVGKYSWASSRDKSSYFAVDIPTGVVTARSTIGVGDVGARGDFLGWRARGMVGAARRSPDGIAVGVVASANAAEEPGSAPLDAAVAVRATDLAPHRQASAEEPVPVVMDFSQACFAMAVGRGNLIEVYGPQQQQRWMLDAPKIEADIATDFRLLSLSAGCYLWSCDQRGESLWTVSTTHLIRRRVPPGASGMRVAEYVRPGKPYDLDLAGKYQQVVALAANESGTRVWALWEGADTFLHTQRADSKDLGVAVYDMTKPRQKTLGYGETVEPSAQFRLARHPTGGARVMREFFISASEKTIVAVNEHVIACYDAETGELKHELPPTHTFAVSPDHKYLGGASWREEIPAAVWDVDSGEKVMETGAAGKVIKIAFGEDSSTLHVGWKGGRLASYDVETGKEFRSIATAVAPVRMIPGSSRFVGFVPTSGPMGDLVLADTADGRPVSVLAEGMHVLTKCLTNEDGSALSIVRKSQVDIVPRITAETAGRMLDSLDRHCNLAWRKMLAARDYPDSEADMPLTETPENEVPEPPGGDNG